MIRLKNEQEIAGIRRSCHLLADMFNEIIPQVKAGMSTKEVDTICKNFMLSHHGKPAWYRENFPGAICISVNEEVIHGIPSSKRIIHDGDLVSIDAGIDLDGYISDSTHTVLVGNVRPEWKELDDVTLECLRAGIAECVPGNRISDISNAVNDIAAGHKYGVVYEYCGHGVGLDVHEDPSIPNCPSRGPNPRIQAGMVLAIEPMINLGTADVVLDSNEWTVLTADGKASAHEEHTVAVFADHTEILTDLRYAG
jgi:methionine aminopeptidase, type I